MMMMKVTWKKESKKRPLPSIPKFPNLPFEQPDQEEDKHDHLRNQNKDVSDADSEQVVGSRQPFDSEESNTQIAQSFQAQGNKLAEDEKYREALGKWEAALNLMPENAVLHEQKAQVLLEIGDAWNAVKAASRAIKLEPSWAEAWVTLGRAQLNFGEPDSAIESFDRSLAVKPDSKEAEEDRHTALQLVKRRKQLHSSGLSADTNRYVVGDKTEIS